MSSCSASCSEKATGGLVAVPVDLARVSSLQCDIYLQTEGSRAPILYRRQSHPLEEADLERLTKRGVTTLYITKSHESAYREKMYEEVCRNESIPPVERFRVLRDISEAVFETAFRSGTVDDMVGFTEQMGNQLTALISRKDTVVEELFAILKYDNGTYTHCVNVSTYCLLLAARLGVSGISDLESISSGALLHDIGKRHVQLSILNKPGLLTDEQRAQIQRHSTLGFVELALRDDLNWGQLMTVYQHHERMDGSGYPTGISDDEIPPWARLCSIADVFHALTSVRPYRTPLSFHAALAAVEEQSGSSFDPEMVKCWNSIVKTTPCMNAS
jgi:putative nucleotidyltransferase with HDIG domain